MLRLRPHRVVGHMLRAWHYDPSSSEKQAERLSSAAGPCPGLEPEFYLLSRENGKLSPADTTDDLEKPCYDYKGLARQRNFLEKISESLGQVGLDVYQIDHEDANGQFEINFFHKDCVSSADNIVFFRMAAVEVCREAAWSAPLLPSRSPPAPATACTPPLHKRRRRCEPLYWKNDPRTWACRTSPKVPRRAGAHAPALTALGGPA